MEKKILVLVLAVVFAVGAGYLGYIFGQNQVLPQADAGNLKFINSSLAKNVSVSLFGKVAGVAGTTLTIEEEGSSLSLEVPTDTVIIKQSEVSNDATPPAPEQISLEDLKTGDLVSVSVLFGNGNKVISLNIMVLKEPVQGSPLPVPAE